MDTRSFLPTRGRTAAIICACSLALLTVWPSSGRAAEIVPATEANGVVTVLEEATTLLAVGDCEVDGLKACVWQNGGYGGDRSGIGDLPDSGGTPWLDVSSQFLIRSAKNKFGARRMLVANESAGGNIIDERCIPANSNEPGPLTNPRELFKIGASGQNPNC